jgi:ssRNA-specific RNase YbeY (16S rRNA maturation enzyme)
MFLIVDNIKISHLNTLSDRFNHHTDVITFGMTKPFELTTGYSLDSFIAISR